MIGTNHHCRTFVLSPLIFGPQDEVMPVDDAILWSGSHSQSHVGPGDYSRLRTICRHECLSSETFIDAVMKAHEVKLAASDRPQPGYDVPQPHSNLNK
jgi:hypothetical protein